MTNEIKEILFLLYNDMLTMNGKRELEDYITNLQNQLEEKTYLYNKLDTESKYAITNLQNKYDKSLELLANFNMPCEYDEGKISHNYCEEFCDTDDETYKKCWNKYIENILRGEDNE